VPALQNEVRALLAWGAASRFPHFSPWDRSTASASA